MDVGKVLAWSTYDLANTAFSALFVTLFFPMYVKEVLGGTEFQIGLVFGISMLAVGLFVPIIGAFSDAVKRRLPFIIIFTICCVIFTSITGYVGLFWALVGGFIANFFYHAALTTYNALLPQVAESKEMGFISGIGTSLGYLGTLMSLGVALAIFTYFGWDSPVALKLMFPATGIFFLVLSFPTFFGVKEKIVNKRLFLWKKLPASVFTVIKTVSNMEHHKGMVSFLFAIFAYINAISAVIIFLFLYSRSEMGLSIQEFMLVYVIFSVAATVGSFFYGILVDNMGAKKGLSIAGILWIVVVFILLFYKNYPAFIIAGMIGGVALGAVWTSIRPMLIRLSPKKHIGQFFGFTELADKFSGVIGPIIFGALATEYSYNASLISLLVFFIVGLIVLQKVPDKR